MAKKEIETGHYLYPMPAVLVGASVNGKPNYLVAAFCGIVDLKPPKVAVALGKAHYTNIGIKEHNSFSVSVPGTNIAEKVDYCGLQTGHKTDKSTIFRSWYGKLVNAPMPEECPICLECKLVKTLELDVDELFIGEIVASWVEEDVLTKEGKPDMTRVDPLVFAMGTKDYWKIGDRVGGAWSMGKEYKPD